MLTPESRRSWETARPLEPDSNAGRDREPRESDPTPTVLRTSGSSARRLQGQAGPPPPLPSPGEVIGSFLLEEAIGAGGMGAVFRALDTQLDRQVALKLLPPDQAVDPEVVQRFYQEGRSAAQLDHENIARVFSIGQDGPFHHIAFEYIEGVTLRYRVESTGPLKPTEAVDVALQIANALVHASRRGVVHRDIKPSNIILTPQGRAKVVDMGLARRFERGGDHGLTQSGMTLGTFDYISPEQARDPRDVDVRSDLYSLGCTMFHMLTGRPPFPGGTVLQKLIQHQEEPPADVRTLNPDVPAELSAIIAKLMAKERDRRYQGPEHLVRDLLTLAGSLGMERPTADLEPWTLHPHHAWWEHHLIWLLPAMAFVIAIAGLAWWGREFSRPPGPANLGSHSTGPELKIAESPGPMVRPSAAPAGSDAATADAASYLQPISVSSKQDLNAVLASAPPGAEIVLSDDGPYRLSGRAWSARDSKAGPAPDLHIRADRGLRPVLSRAEGIEAEAGPSSSLLDFDGGRVVIEGLLFELGASESGEPSSAIRCEDTELVVRECTFRRPGGSLGDRGEVAAILVRNGRTGLRVAERPPAVLLDACHFDGGQPAVRARGTADVTMRDCTLGPAAPSIWFGPSAAGAAVPGELRLIHTSILVGPGPVFRFEGGAVRARVDDCVIAAAGRTAAGLVQAVDPKELNWRGRGNLYGSIGPFLATPPGSPQPTTIRDFSAWEQASAEPRELGSRISEIPVWDAPDPTAALAQEREDPTPAFLLRAVTADLADVGARKGPFRSTLTTNRLTQRPSPSRPSARSTPAIGDLARVESKNRPRQESAAGPEADLRRPDVTAEGPTPAGDEATPPSDPMSLPTMPPMATSGATQPDMEPEAEDMVQPMPMPMPMPIAVPSSPDEMRQDAVSSKSATSPPPAASFSDEDVVRSTEQFLAMVRHLGDQGGTIRIASGLELDLPTVDISVAAPNKLQIVGETGGVRPRLRFRPAPVAGTSLTDWVALFSLHSGSLRLQGVDLIVPDPDGRPADRLAAMLVVPGTDLALEDCTVTLAARGINATAFAIQPPGGAAESPRDASIRIRAGFIRSGGDAVVVAGGGRLALQLEDVMVATDGSLLHDMGRGGGRGQAATRPSLSVRIDRVCARVKGGLVHLRTTPEEPEMAAVEIRADNSILSTVTGDHPLFWLEGQDQLERLRDRIRWVGRKVAYHHIKTYRRDEIVHAGGLPRIFDRDDWMRAFEPTDEVPMLTDLKFRQQADATVPAWKVVRDDLSLAANSPARPLGPDADRIPDPPPPDEEL